MSSKKIEAYGELVGNSVTLLVLQVREGGAETSEQVRETLALGGVGGELEVDIAARL